MFRVFCTAFVQYLEYEVVRLTCISENCRLAFQNLASLTVYELYKTAAHLRSEIFLLGSEMVL